MPDTTTKPITVSANAGIIDLLTAAGRYLVVIATAIPILLQLLGTRNIGEIISYFRGDSGSTLIAAVVGLATLAYGLFKTRKRGAQIATVALDSRVPDRVAKIG
jgi:uncharacterized RDD family membrane protein YckC